jgi:hypothetical protein
MVDDTTLCALGSITLDAGNTYNSYAWVDINSPTTILSIASLVTVNPSVTTSYLIYAEDISNCPPIYYVDTVTVAIDLPPQTTLNAAICSGDSIYAGGNFQYLVGTYYDTLAATGGCDSIIVTNLSIFPLAYSILNIEICDGDSYYTGGGIQTISGAYHDTLSAWNGCDSVIITYLDVLPIPITNVSQTICSYDSVFVGGGFQDQAGTYYDTLSTNIGCDSIIITNLIIQHPPSLSTTPDTSIMVGDIISLVANGAVSYTWSTGETGNTITVNPTQTTTYFVTGTDGLGCSTTAEIIVDIMMPYQIYVPNVFSKNSANPDNRMLYVFGSGIASLDFKVYDRWGGMVYGSQEAVESFRNDGQCCRYGEGWDGSYLGEGILLNHASFGYVLKGTFTNGKTFFESGSINLINNKL